MRRSSPVGHAGDRAGIGVADSSAFRTHAEAGNPAVGLKATSRL
jgi:hypothetical protein